LSTSPTTLTNVTAVLSLLHEPADRNSATRRFRTSPVLRWTLDRLARATRVGTIALLCWEDQVEAVAPLAAEAHADVLSKGPRTALPEIESVAAARRWADGWRGGLLSTCAFDLGFHGPWVKEIADQLASDAVLLIDPASALVDPLLIDALIAHGDAHAGQDICFMPSAPGLSGALLRPALLGRLAAAKAHPGRLMHYHPDQLSREPLAAESCAPVPTPVARTTRRFLLDSDRQARRMEDATVPLNGELIATPAEDLVARLHAWPAEDVLPREVVLELTTRRATRPIYSPVRYLEVGRPVFTRQRGVELFNELADADDLRLSLAGVGDPLLSGELFPILDAARDAGVRAIHVETDLLAPDDAVARLAAAPVDVVSVHVPALTAKTYAEVMGLDAYAKVLANIKLLLTERVARRAGVPLLVPTFTKCRANLAEMEAWYDQWLRAAGSAVIVGPADFGGTVPDDGSVADMAPPRRRPCARLASRLMVLSDGRVVSCEQDALARQVMGELGKQSIREIWQQRFGALRAEHREEKWAHRPVCAACREWHRP
jgi:MoaA/NifB/PqqE/SkfB family radical SAM enzyme